MRSLLALTASLIRPRGCLTAVISPLAPPREWLAAAVSVLVPPGCSVCAGPVSSAAEPLCAGCRAELPWLREPRCACCGLPLPCGRRCPGAQSAVERAWAPLAHEGSARAVVHAFKLRGALRLGEVMAAQIAAGAPTCLLAAPAVLVPVPTHARRRRRRGYDHAGRLADALGARTGLPVARCLARRGPETQQRGAARSVRTAEGRIAVAVVAPAPQRALLVDDVHTTGSTLDACARALRAAGTVAVCAVTYARALR